MSKLPTVKEYFQQWCKETKRSGGVLVHSSIGEFLDKIEEYANLRTQALREENERLKRENDELHSKLNKWHDYDI